MSPLRGWWQRLRHRAAPSGRWEYDEPEPSGWSEPVTPLTQDRVADALARRKYSYLVDDDGDLTGVWDGNRFWFMLLGEHEEVLQVRGVWHRTMSPAQLTGVRLALNDWNRDRIWPKVYHREEDGRVLLYAEHSIDLETGVNDSQLDQTISCGLMTSVRFFQLLDDGFPAEATAE